MLGLIIFLIVTIIFLLVQLISYRRQVGEICRHIEFVKKNNTNKILFGDYDYKELKKLEDEINELSEKAKKDALKIRKTEGVLKETITNISHDIRTPLTSLEGYFQLLSLAETEEEREKYIGIIKGRIGSLREMLEELFTYTKLQNEGYSLELQKINFTDAVCKTLLSFFNDFEEQGIVTETDISEEEIFIRGNTEAVSRIVQNIMKNTLEHGSKRVKITLKQEENRIIFRCENEAENTDEIDVSQVFTRFYKADSARTHSSTGLGLAIAKGLSEKMNGTMRAGTGDGMFFVEWEVRSEE